MVIKFGGNAMVDEELMRSFASDMTYLHYVGINPVIVHGGGPQITAALNAAGIESEFRGGYRYTSTEAIRVVQDVLEGEVQSSLTNAIVDDQVRGVGLGAESGLFSGVRKTTQVNGEEIDLGHVGEITRVDAAKVFEVLAAGNIPVVTSVATGPEGETLNVNADAAAAALTVAVGAAKLMLLTDVEGLYSDWPNRDSLLSSITVAELEKLLPNLESGMIPKMRACLDAVVGGVPKAAIIDGRAEHSILLEIFTPGGSGTEVIP
ncbi:MAG: acetylglutamate kinase [Microbacteriaceae bacterium]|nr:acetylglutamate kinase [Microbacteriaceae bacterium]